MSEKLCFHPIADCFELISGEEFDALGDDIEKYGLIDPIVLLGGKILEGRNRYRACLTRGIDYETVDFAAKQFKAYHGNPLAFVLSKNVRRRQMSESQRAAAAAQVAIISRTYGPYVSYREAASLLNVSERLVQEAAHVIGDAEPELTDAMKNGHITTSAAGQAAALPKAAQRAVAKAAERNGTHAAAEEVQTQQASIIDRKGCELLKQAVADGVVSVKAATKIAKEAVPVQMEMVRTLLTKHAEKITAKAEAEEKKASKAAEKEAKKKPAAPEPPAEILDQLDQQVPERLHHIFSNTAFKDWINALNAIARGLKEVGETPVGAMLRYQQADLQLKDLKRTLKFDAPYSVCAMCKAVGDCQACKGRGWLNEASYKALPAEYRL